MSCWTGPSVRSYPPVVPGEAHCPAPSQHWEVPLMSPTSSAGSCPLMTPWAVTGQAWTTSCVRSHSQLIIGSSHVPMVRGPAPPSLAPLLPLPLTCTHVLPHRDHPNPSFLCAPPLPPGPRDPPLRVPLPCLQEENAPTESSAGSSTRRGRAAPSAPWQMSSVPMPCSHPLGPPARTKVAGDLHLHLSLALCPQSVSSAAWKGRNGEPRQPQGPTERV